MISTHLKSIFSREPAYVPPAGRGGKTGRVTRYAYRFIKPGSSEAVSLSENTSRLPGFPASRQSHYTKQF